MRIIRFLFVSALVIGVVGGAAFLLAREVLLLVASSQIKSSFAVARQSNATPGSPTRACQNESTLRSGDALVDVYALQLVFTNDSQYQWELICDSTFHEPQVLAEYQLPMFVTKLPGSAGLLWREPYSAFTIGIWGRYKSFILQDRELTTTESTLAERPVQQPVARCSGHGYQCCSLDSQIGTGGQETQVRDCPLSCFATCQSRPVILSLSSQPFADPQTRVVETKAGEQVAISYVVDAGTGRTATIELDFGDGETHKTTSTTGTVEHSYRCAAVSCEYQLTLTATDDRGYQNASGSINRLQIRVTAQ